MALHNHPEPKVTPDDVFLAFKYLESATNALRETEAQWEATSTLLSTEVFDTASELNIDVDNLYDGELHLLADIKLIEEKLKLGYGSHWDRAAKTTMCAKEEKLAALRDLSNTLDWLVSPDRAAASNPKSASVPDRRGLIRDLEAKLMSGEAPEKVWDKFHSLVLTAATVVSGKTSSLEREVRKVESAAEIVGDLHWRPDDAPLTAILLFD